VPQESKSTSLNTGLLAALVVALVAIVLLAMRRTIVLESPSSKVPVRQAAAPQRSVRIGAETRKCLECHETKGITASAIRDWKQSKHAEIEVGCEKCHIPAASASKELKDSASSCEDRRVRRNVSAENCKDCHATQVNQFANSKHAVAWVAMNAMPMTHKMPRDILARGCGACHNIGLEGGKCDSCHTRHRFAASEARRPEACMTCHMGFDHPQWEMYSTSKHGAIYQLEGANWDWNMKLADWFSDKYHADPDTPRTPTCAYCHMPSGDHTVKTAWGFLAVRLAEKDKQWQEWRNTIFKGLGVIDEQGQPTDRFKVVAAGSVARLSAEEWTKQRERVKNQCTQCHAPTFVNDQLDQADRIVREADHLMAEAVEVVNGLYKDGLLPKPADRPPVADLLQFYEVPNPIEQKLYTMFLEHRMRTFQGAFHMNPDYLHWYGWAEMRRDLEEIKYEAGLLRADKAAKAESKK